MLPRRRGYRTRAVQSLHLDAGTLYLRTPTDLLGFVEDAWAHCLDRPLCAACAHVVRVVSAEIRERQQQPPPGDPVRERRRRGGVRDHLAAVQRQQRTAEVPS